MGLCPREKVQKNCAVNALFNPRDGSGERRNLIARCRCASSLNLPDDARVPVFPKDDVHVVVVGGETNATMQGWNMYGATTASIDKWR